MGEGWRNLPSEEIDGAWGIAIIRSVLDGVGSDNEPSWRLRQIANHLGVEAENLKDAIQIQSHEGMVPLRGFGSGSYRKCRLPLAQIQEKAGEPLVRF